MINGKNYGNKLVGVTVATVYTTPKTEIYIDRRRKAKLI